MKPLTFLSIAFMNVLLFAGCGPAATPTPTPNAQATGTAIAASIFATQTADAPTATVTPRPTITAAPTPSTMAATPIPSTPGEIVVTSTLQSGWTRYELQTSGFAIALPPGWIALNLSPSGMANALSIAGDQNPSIKTLLSSENLRKMMAAGIRFYALDSSSTSLSSLIPTSVNVLKIDIGFSLPLDSVVSLTLEQLEKLAGLPVTHRRITLSNKEAEEIKYQTNFNSVTGNPVPTSITQFILMDGTTQYVVTCGAASKLAQGEASTFEKIGQSFLLIKQ